MHAIFFYLNGYFFLGDIYSVVYRLFIIILNIKVECMLHLAVFAGVT